MFSMGGNIQEKTDLEKVSTLCQLFICATTDSDAIQVLPMTHFICQQVCFKNKMYLTKTNPTNIVI